MEILRIKKEEEEKRRQYSEEKERLMGRGRVGYQIPPEQPIQLKPDEKIPTFPANNLYPSNQVPSMTHETKASARYVESCE